MNRLTHSTKTRLIPPLYLPSPLSPIKNVEDRLTKEGNKMPAFDIPEHLSLFFSPNRSRESVHSHFQADAKIRKRAG